MLCAGYLVCFFCRLWLLLVFTHELVESCADDNEPQSRIEDSSRIDNSFKGHDMSKVEKMKRLISLLMLTLVFSSLALAMSILTNGYINITVIEAKAMIDSNPSLVVLDVRTQSEYENDGHIRNAKLIPVTELPTRLDELNKTDEILVYCKLGGRSTSASQILVDNDFLHVYNMLGGITAWKTEKYAVYIKYSFLQEAINTANEGTPIFVSSGIYYENVVVNKTVSLFGENISNTVIDGNLTGTPLSIAAMNVFISGFVIQQNSSVGGPEDISGIFLNYSVGSTIQGNRLVSNNYGIYLEEGYANLIVANDFFNYTTGIYLHKSSGNNITQNYLNSHNKSGYGIRLASSSNNSLIKNVCTNNCYGIYLQNSSENTISNIAIYNNYYGIHFENSSNNRMIKSLIQSNTQYGIWFKDSSNNAVTECNIINNSYGILSQPFDSSTNNSIYHNNFFNNNVQISLSTSTYKWDNGYPSGGNYWSDYRGSDSLHGPNQEWLGGDGIGDTPYIIDENNVDRYPLMYSYGSESIRGGGSSKKSRR